MARSKARKTADLVAGNGISTADLAADVIDSTKIADDAVDSEHYVDGSIDTAHIANNAVTADKLAAGAAVPSQSGQSGKYLTTDGSTASWGTVDLTSKQDVLAEGSFADGDKTKLDGIESGATADQTAAEILTAIKTVDGSGSGLDADTLDGNQATAFATAAQGALADSAVQNLGDLSITASAAELNLLDGVTATTAELNYVDGVTSNIQTQLNSKQASGSYLTGNQTITLSGDVSGSGTTSISVTVADDSHNHVISNVDGLQTALDGKVDDSQVLTNVPAGAVFTDTTYSVGNGGLTEINFTSALNSKLAGIESGATADQTASEILTAIKTVDGAGSGLDADTVDGIQASSFLQGNQTITLSGDATGSGTTAITVALAANSVGASEIVDNSVGAAELNVSGNGTTSQFLRSDGDGTFTWATPTDTNTTYSAGSGLDLSGTTFSVEPDLRDGITHIGLDSGDYIGFTNNSRIDFYVNSSNEFRMESDGDFHADGDVIAYSTTISDERLKDNIVGIDGALEKVSQLNGYTFSYKADGKVSAGVIAQEVEKVLPEAVSEKELPLKVDDGQEYKVVNYDALHGLLIEAIKELKAEIEVLKEAK